MKKLSKPEKNLLLKLHAEEAKEFLVNSKYCEKRVVEQLHEKGYVYISPYVDTKNATFDYWAYKVCLTENGINYSKERRKYILKKIISFLLPFACNIATLVFAALTYFGNIPHSGC